MSDEWLDAVRAHVGTSAGARDLTVRLHVAVGDVQFHAIVDNGALEALAPGPLSDASANDSSLSQMTTFVAVTPLPANSFGHTSRSRYVAMFSDVGLYGST